MNKPLSFLRLDYITVKPYFTLKNLVIFCGVALIMIISSGTSVSAISILMAYAALYVSYPFAVCEQNGIDALYTTLSIKRKTVVLGRYLFALIIDICAGLLAYVFSFAVLTIMKKEFNALESLVILLIMFVIFSIIQAIQLPIYFKLGYAKAKMMAYLPFVGVALVTILITNFLKDSLTLSKISGFFAWFTANPHIAAVFGVVIWLGIMIISYQTSCLNYSKRDF